jgi:hypothetical protein
MCRADICNTCRCTTLTVSEKKSRKSSITSSFVESGRISLIYCSKIRMNLRRYPLTAGEAISSSSRLILLSRAPTRKTTSCRRRAVSVGTLFFCRSWRPSCSRRISRCGGLSCTARVVVGGSKKRAAGVTRSRWRHSIPLASLDPAGAESTRRGSMG